MRVAPPVVIDSSQKAVLEQWARSRSLPARQVERARVVLLASEGKTDLEIAAELRIGNHKVARWRKRFLKLGLAGLGKDASRRGRKPAIPASVKLEIVHKATRCLPSNATHWSTRNMASEMGVSEATVRRVWHANGLKPHLIETFKVSKDKRFAEKVEAIVGLYLNPPEHAMVLCVDEKSRIQALDRTQPGLPLKKGRCGTMTHDYKRNGTTTLFAALDLLQGKVIGDFHKRHRHQEFLKFLRRIDREFAGGKTLHVVMDNYGTHGTAEVKAWLRRHPRFVIHYVPTSCSWLNLIERWFAELTNKRIRRDSFFSVDELVAAINDFLTAWNENPKPFVWTATVDSIVAKLARCRQTLEQIQPGCTAPKRRKRLSS